MSKWKVTAFSTYPIPDFTTPEFSEEDPEDYAPESFESTNYFEAHLCYLRESGKMNTETACLERVVFELWNEKRNEWVTLFESRCFHTPETYGL